MEAKPNEGRGKGRRQAREAHPRPPPLPLPSPRFIFTGRLLLIGVDTDPHEGPTTMPDAEDVSQVSEREGETSLKVNFTIFVRSPFERFRFRRASFAALPFFPCLPASALTFSFPWGVWSFKLCSQVKDLISTRRFLKKERTNRSSRSCDYSVSMSRSDFSLVSVSSSRVLKNSSTGGR